MDSIQHSLQSLQLLVEELNPQLARHPEINAVLTHLAQSVDGNAPLLDCPLESQDALAALSRLKSDLRHVPFPPPHAQDFRFVDLFAGIGGFRIALQRLGGECVFSSEWDRAAKEVYFKNFGEYPFGDIRQFTDPSITDDQLAAQIPDHDLLAAGFPCQPFSRAGVSARTSLGKHHGFACEAQGTLFFDVVRIASVKRPAILLLENVKNLASHDQGETFRVIRKTIEEDLGYSFFAQVLDARTLVPQKRQRCFMVCFRDKIDDFEFPVLEGPPLALKSILEADVDSSYGISEALWRGHQTRSRRNVERGVGFTASEAALDQPANTLVARYGKDGKECLVPRPGTTPRMLTPRECARLQGFPEAFILPTHRTPAYRQFGNSVPIPLVEAVAKAALRKWNSRLAPQDHLQPYLPEDLSA